MKQEKSDIRIGINLSIIRDFAKARQAEIATKWGSLINGEKEQHHVHRMENSWRSKTKYFDPDGSDKAIMESYIQVINNKLKPNFIIDEDHVRNLDWSKLNYNDGIELKHNPKNISPTELWKNVTIKLRAEIDSEYRSIFRLGGNPFHQWIYDIIEKKHLSPIINEIIDDIKSQKESDQVAYSDEVLSHLFNDQTEMTLALFGKKFTENALNKDYFSDFMTFAERKANEYRSSYTANKNTKITTKICVCRIFIQPDRGNFDEDIKEIIETHVENEHNGVVAMVVPKRNRAILNRSIHPEFCNKVDQGLGFIFFQNAENGNRSLIIHEGVRSDGKLPYYKFENIQIVNAFYKIYTRLFGFIEIDKGHVRLNKGVVFAQLPKV